MNTHGCWPRWPIRIIIGFICWPETGSGLITPTTGFSGVITREMAREMSYSSRRSRSGERNGDRLLLIEHAHAQAEIERLAVKAACWPSTPSSFAESSASESGSGSSFWISICPFDACRYSPSKILDALRVGLENAPASWLSPRVQ